MSHDDFAAEPIKGLPELPPRGEVILWQGRPNWWRLAVESLNLWWVMAYFAVLTVWRFLTVVDTLPLDRAIAVSLPFLVIAAVVAVMLLIVSYIQARATVYTKKKGRYCCGSAIDSSRPSRSQLSPRHQFSF